MTLIAFVFFLLTLFAAGFITGLTSFGGNLISIPLMALIMPVRDAIIIGCLSFTFIIPFMIWIFRKDVPWREVLILNIGGLVGGPAGTWLLARSPVRFLFLASGIAIAIFLFWQWLLPRLGKRSGLIPQWFAWPCGFLAGLMTGTVGMGGPPIAFYAYMRHWKKESAIGGLAAAFGLQMLSIIISQWQEDFYNWPLLKQSMWASLALCCGVLLSLPVVRRVNIRLFRILVLTMLTFSALTLLVKGLLA